MGFWSRTAAAAIGVTALVSVASTAGASATGATAGTPPETPLAVVRTVNAGLPLNQTSPYESLYVPITPCRIVDTRIGTGTPLANLQTRTYYVAGIVGFTEQGGHSGGCGIPAGTVAVAATVTAVSPSRAGYVRAWPAGQPEPAATVLNYGTVSNGTGATLSVNADAARALSVRNHGGPTDLVIDVFGYYVKQLAASINYNGGVIYGSSRLLDSYRRRAGEFVLTFDRDIDRCSATANGWAISNVYANTSFEGGGIVVVLLSAQDGTPADANFYITVTC